MEPTAAAPGAPFAPAVCPTDLSVTCWNCGEQMAPEHAHYRCAACGWRDTCCDGVF